MTGEEKMYTTIGVAITICIMIFFVSIVIGLTKTALDDNRLKFSASAEARVLKLAEINAGYINTSTKYYGPKRK